jgi:hypothetical protein
MGQLNDYHSIYHYFSEKTLTHYFTPKDFGGTYETPDGEVFDLLDSESGFVLQTAFYVGENGDMYAKH